MKEIAQIVKDFLFEVFGKDGEVISVIPNDGGWQVTAELLMDEDYTIKRGRSDLLYVFDVILDESCNVMSYNRTGIRERGKLLEE
ncbi:gas vesicle protein GvpO [Anaerobacterium chartisolvens]|uniref:Gas vesicle protein GvpO n=1 Tax=Anaerobacterium chartisolvens TaxID=1297424 RepID=A0A369AW86_9FIRM|nr:gas vesicle protein GvpO [Anaerobacterium chartisolvens]RCX12516.1 gas vesicle protein GvpO [Anaerobacterium chartisolvens]